MLTFKRMPVTGFALGVGVLVAGCASPTEDPPEATIDEVAATLVDEESDPADLESMDTQADDEALGEQQQEEDAEAQYWRGGVYRGPHGGAYRRGVYRGPYGGVYRGGAYRGPYGGVYRGGAYRGPYGGVYRGGAYRGPYGGGGFYGGVTRVWRGGRWMQCDAAGYCW